MTTQQRIKTVARWTGVVLSVLSVAFAIISFTTHWDWWRGDDMVEKVAERFDLSYSDDAARPVQQGDPEWPPLLRLIEQYSPHRGELPKDRPAMTFARFKAIFAAGAAGAEWTAPTTQIALLYRKWPDPGGEFKLGQNVFVIGTIGDLHDWVRQDRADFDFFWRTIIFGLLSACVGVVLALADTPPAPPDANQPAKRRHQGRR